MVEPDPKELAVFFNPLDKHTGQLRVNFKCSCNQWLATNTLKEGLRKVMTVTCKCKKTYQVLLEASIEEVPN